MKLMVCGSIGNGGVEKIKKFYNKLKQAGFDTLDHIEAEGMDYSDINDFRDKKDLSKKIVEYDLKYIEKADVVVVLADKPSYGTAIEMYVAKKAGKKVIFLATKSMPTPWPIYFSDYVVRIEKELIEILTRLKSES